MPTIYVIGGPNGAGKTTTAMAALPTVLHCREFVNADEIVRGLSPFAPATVDAQAGRLMLERIEKLRAERCDFALEVTLASRSMAKFLKGCQADGYVVVVFYVWLRTPQLAIRRVRERVQAGGHNVPEDVIRRRYRRSARNFIELYAQLADSWICYDNSEVAPVLLGEKTEGDRVTVADARGWQLLAAEAKREEDGE